MPAPTHCRPEAFREFERQMPVLHTCDGLLRTAVAVSRHELRGVHLDLIEGVLDQYAQEIRKRAPGLCAQPPGPRRNEALLATVHALLFDEAGYRGNRERYDDTRNSYIPEVVRTRRGIPISLCLVYKAVCARVGIPVAGVNAPFHFLARVETHGTPALVDPFGAGRLVDPREAVSAIRDVLPDRPPERESATESIAAPHDTPQADIDDSDVNNAPPEATSGMDRDVARLLPTATHADWIARMLRNLALLFERQGRPNDVGAMLELGRVLGAHHPISDATGADDMPEHDPPE